MSFISSVFGMNNKEIAGRDSPMTLADQFKWMSMKQPILFLPLDTTDTDSAHFIQHCSHHVLLSFWKSLEGIARSLQMDLHEVRDVPDLCPTRYHVVVPEGQVQRPIEEKGGRASLGASALRSNGKGQPGEEGSLSAGRRGGPTAVRGHLS